MTDPYERDRILGTDAILQEIKQFRRLEPLMLNDAELAHRMVNTVKEVRQIRSLLGQGKRKIGVLGLDRRTFNLLDANGIRTLNNLLARSDAQLLLLPRFGPKTLRNLKEALCNFMEKENGTVY